MKKLHRIHFTNLARGPCSSVKIKDKESAEEVMNETPIVLGGVISDIRSYTTTPHRFLIRSLVPTNPEHFRLHRKQYFSNRNGTKFSL